MDINFENIGKFIQRNNLALILFCTFSLVTSIQIQQFNRNHDVVESFKTQIITDRSIIFLHLKKAINLGSEDKKSLWLNRFKEDDATNLINHELNVAMLSQWFDKFWREEKNQETAIELQQIFFLLSSIETILPQISDITGNEITTIEAALDSMNSYLGKKEIKEIKLPILGSEISVSLLTIIVPIIQCALLAIVSAYLFLAAQLMNTLENASDFLSNTLLYLTEYDKGAGYIHIFRISRLIPTALMFGVIYSLEIFKVSSWQVYITLGVSVIHIISCMMLDAKITLIMKKAKESENNIASIDK